MNSTFKSPDIITLKKFDSPGLVLKNQNTGKVCVFDENDASKWMSWNIDFHDKKLKSLQDDGFVVVREELLPAAQLEIDSIIPLPLKPYAKWFFESPELAVLFNTKQMQKNPLLVLNNYGSLCWRGITERKTIGEIRKESKRVFGVDEVVSFLNRLVMLEFIEPFNHLQYSHDLSENVTKEFFAPYVQFQITHARIPWYCLWEICMKCNYRCKVCYLPHFKTSGPSLDQALDIAQQIIDAGIFYVCLLGGEPLLRNDVETIVEKLRSEGVFVKLISNGHYLSKDRARSLVDAGLNQIEISFDGLSRVSHELSRGEGTYRRAIEAVKIAKRAGIPRIAVVWTAYSENFYEAAKLPDFLNELEVHECYISPFKKTGLNGSKSLYTPLSPHEIYLINEKNSQWQSVYPQLTITLLPTCSCGHTSLVIGDNGDVRLCSFSYYSIGNIFEKSLTEIWNFDKVVNDDSQYWGFCPTNVKTSNGPFLK